MEREDRLRRDLDHRCKRWATVNQDEYRNPGETKIERYIQSEEMARYEDCLKCKKAPEDEQKAVARHLICCNVQNEMREPTFIPDDHHINPAAKCKPPWCRCLATGDPNWYDENRGEKETEDLCQCKRCYNQMEATADNNRQRIYSSTYYLDYRHPDFPYIQTKMENQEDFKKRFKEYKAKRDAEDALKEPRHDIQRDLVTKMVWTSTYREMNKTGAALPIAIRDIPATSRERNANPIQNAAELSEKTLVPIGSPTFEKWDRPQVRLMAGRCDTMYNRPDLEKDAYFQEHRLCRTKFARDPAVHTAATKENMNLVMKEKLRLCYDKPIPGYAGYDCVVAPPVCKIKKNMNRWDPYEIMSNYQANYIFHPEEIYASPVQALRPDDFDRMGIATSPISTLSKIPLPDAQRLYCCREPPREDAVICGSS